MKRILVTGGCGFLGSNVAVHFLREGWQVTLIDALLRQGAAANLDWLRSQAREGQLTCVIQDLAEEAGVRQAFRQHGPFDFVCHLAGQVAMTTSLSDPRRDLLTNILGTFNVLEAARQLSPDTLLAYSSTNKVYGDLEWVRYQETATRYLTPDYPEGFDETIPLDFASPYGCSKGAADQYVRDWHRNYRLKTVVFRHSSIYGGRQFATFDQGWLGWFCLQALRQQQAVRAGQKPEPFTIAGNGKQVRDVLHGEDLVRLYAAAYERRDQVAGQIFNIGGGQPNSLSLLELFDLLGRLTGVTLSFTQNPPRPSDQKVFVADIRKAGRLLGWSPSLSKEQGIPLMLRWVEGAQSSSPAP
ncbi:MAG: SDR family NAD(P)-dependent oxidoreductase [Verrucomicrobiota bacterium]|jgi:CDP-paratose 2-epimerase